jgi:hypothetical protein
MSFLRKGTFISQTTNTTDVEVLLPEIKDRILKKDKTTANSLFSIIVDKALELKGKPILIGDVAEVAEQLGHKIKAAQLYEVAGTTFSNQTIYFLSKALTLYNEYGEVADTQRIEKKLKLHLGVPKRDQ